MALRLDRFDLDRFVADTLAEDLGDHGDVTSAAVIPAEARFAGVMRSREPIVVAGLPIAEAFFHALDPEAAIERCKDGIDNASEQLSEDAKDSLKDICEKAGSGNVEDARDAIVEVCKKNAANIPEGVPGRDRAIAACEQAGK